MKELIKNDILLKYCYIHLPKVKICDDVYVSNFKVNGSSIKVENNLFLNTNYLYFSERERGENISFKKLKRCYGIS
jgi:hypothetical protein